MAETQTDALSGIDTNAFQSAMKLGLRPGSKEFWAHFGLLRRISPDYAHLKTDQELDWTDYFLDELSGGKHLKEYNDLGAQQRKVLDLYRAMQKKQAEAQIGAVPIPYSEGQAEVIPQVPDMATIGPSTEISQARPPLQMTPPLSGGNSPFGDQYQRGAPALEPPPSDLQTRLMPMETPETLNLQRPMQAPQEARPLMIAGKRALPGVTKEYLDQIRVQPEKLHLTIPSLVEQESPITYHQPGTLAVRGTEVLETLGQKPEAVAEKKMRLDIEQNARLLQAADDVVELATKLGKPVEELKATDIAPIAKKHKVNVLELRDQIQGKKPLVTVQNIPAPSERKDIAEGRSQLDMIDSVEKLYDPSFVGPLDSRIGRLKSFTGAIKEQEAEFRSTVKLMRTELRKFYFGTAQSRQELQGALEALPDTDMSDEQFQAAVTTTKKKIQSLLARQTEVMGQSGVKTPGAAAPSGGTGGWSIKKVE